MLLRDRHVLLTGATGTIGSALAAALAGRGARLSLVARGEEALHGLAHRTGGVAVPGDLTLADTPASVLAAAEAALGPVDVVLHNAGVEVLDELADVDLEAVRQAVLLNLVAPLVLTRLALPSMLRRGRGHVVAVSSLAGVATFPGLAVYGASKAGLTHAMAGLRAELRGTPLRVTTAELGPVDSPMMGRIGTHPPTAAAFARALRLHVLRTLDPEEAASAVVTAVERDRPHVRRPRRAAPLAAVAGAPRTLVRAVLTGIPTATAARAVDDGQGLRR
ncbi:SDR family NAD(P)-dependent oxidoreductase [Phycicoccus duodecadis]|uniref:Short-subunit dehydrogenase n=1 Tax=Phycicoccus duodecadis TaxID=173053 RepID=A0A2N3YJ91_9MICO|nr:SDR family oxidoreductase [Phycicoccus duodecadis]PKW26917.1 short-subunit dehydrogenase [Phycicoccus duodecadis]